MSVMVKLSLNDGRTADVWVNPAYVVWVMPEDEQNGPAVVMSAGGGTIHVEESASEVLARFSGELS